MIVISGTVSGVNYCAELPNMDNFGIIVIKPISSRQTLAGNVIHQTAQKNSTAGTAKYSGFIPDAQAETLEILDNSNSNLFLSDGKSVYKVSIDAKILESKNIGKKKVEIDIKVIEKLHPV